MTGVPGLHALECAVQKYAWGKVGLSSKVGQLVKAGGGAVDSSTPYAEYWFGTHSSGPAHIRTSSGSGEPILLSEYLQRKPEAMGALKGGKMAEAGQLPFLFKVLSVNKALSIQCHPNKKEAQRLHAKDPEHYRDDNHKPEMAVALTEFEAMCGFRPLNEIVKNLDDFPEFAAVVGEAACRTIRSAASDATGRTTAEALEAATRGWMSCEADALAQQLKLMLDRLARKSTSSAGAGAIPGAGSDEKGSGRGVLQRLEALVLRLGQQYPGDVGIFAPLLLNYLTLQPGEAVFLSAMVPHAYLSGDIVECMACSNNVIRAGLTPKFRDVQELCDCLVYESSRPMEQQSSLVTQVSETTTVYTPPDPVDEFIIVSTAIATGQTEKAAFAPGRSPAILVVTEGEGAARGESGSVSLAAGSIFLLEAGQGIEVDARTTMRIFRVHCKPGKEGTFI
jgi:mannose-6-phosphate isomerase